MSFSIKYSNIEFNSNLGTFEIPNFNSHGLIIDRVQFEKESLNILQNAKEFKMKIAGKDIVKMDGAVFIHQLTIDFKPYEHDLLNTCDHVVFGLILAKDKIPNGPNVKTDGNGSTNLYLSFTLFYRDTFGEMRSSAVVTNSDELIRYLGNIRNPSKISFKPKQAMPNGFDLQLKFTVNDSGGYNIFDIGTIQETRDNGATIDWDFSFIPDQILREHFCSYVQPNIPPSTQKGFSAFPMAILVFNSS